MNLLASIQDPNMQWVLFGCMLLGLSGGMLGSFAFLRGRSLLGDALAHAALPGVCLMYLLTGSKSMGLFLIGACLAGLLATASITAITRHTRIKEDSALAIILSVFFGVGIVLLTFIQHSASGNQSGLDKFLFGQAASLVKSDVTVMIVISVLLLAVTTLLFKEFTLLIFDASYGRGLGFPMGALDALLMLMLVTTVVIGLQAVGVVLIAAMLIAPAVTARYWTDRLSSMVILSGLFGALSGMLGTLFSAQVANLPTGPMIVLAATCFFLFSLLFSPKRGLFFRLWRFGRLRSRLLQEDVLCTLYECMELAPAQILKGCTQDRLAQKSGKPPRAVQQALMSLEQQGLVERREPSGEPAGWAFTAAGLQRGHQLILNQRLWDLYLMNEHDYQHLQLDPHQTDITAQLSAEQLATLLLHLESYGLTPKLMTRQNAAETWNPQQKGVSI
jgi:manganese/zinc/iron transport system permease protein